MRIGLIAVDGHGGFPNLALMRIMEDLKEETEMGGMHFG